MANMEDVLLNQQQIIQGIDKLYTNFKKDPSERKNSHDYIRRRLETLESYWQEFQANHVKLREYDHTGHEYFETQQYDLTKEKYIKIQTVFKSYNPESRLETTPNESRASTSQGPTLQHRSTSSKLDEMLKKQHSNFRAFERTTAGIALSEISEKWEFEDLLRTVQARWVAIDTLHWEIDSELEGSNQDYEQVYSKFEKSYNDIKKSINSKLWSVSHRERSTPQMEIPVFYGNYNQWVSFKDLFTEAIHNNPSISNAQKMQHLKSKVKGEAEKLIQHLSISSDNYNACWEILNNRYNNKKLIFTSHMNILMSLPILQQSSATNIKRMHDTTLECLNAIKALGVNIENCDPFIVHILSQKLDSDSYNDYMESLKQPKEIPNLIEFLTFLESKFTIMESTRKKQDVSIPKSFSSQHNQITKYQSGSQHYNNQSAKYHRSSNQVVTQSVNNKTDNTISKYKCVLCNSDAHRLFYCPSFLKMTPQDKRRTVNRLQLCKNCLYDHNNQECKSDKRCRQCNGAHNSILHDVYNSTQTNAQPKMQAQQVRSNSHASIQRGIPEVLLATALINVQARDGTYHKLRVLIDQGSQTSLISENAAQLLKLQRRHCNGVVTGIGSANNDCKGVVTLKCASLNTNFNFQTDAFIMKVLVKNLPNHTFYKPNWTYLEGISLADPEFYISRSVDVLFGADVYSSIIMEGFIKPEQNMPIAQQTRLGWIISGGFCTLQCNIVVNNIDEIKQFWEMEDIHKDSKLSEEDEQCIAFYKNTTTRKSDGSFEVRLPMKENFEEQLGNSRSKALAQFRSLERKFISNVHIADAYKAFMEEYLRLGHMKPVDTVFNTNKPEYLFPHHSVKNADQQKFRVVFDGSSKTSSGSSLNDLMLRGPNLQNDLQALILSWRQYKIGYVADIEKMFRCININEQDQQLQKIFWRFSQSDPIREYALATVTYGTKSAPFLAIMTLKQLSSDSKYQNTEAARVLDKKFFTDDCIHGSHTLSAAKQLQESLIELLKSGGFHLRKWRSNAVELLENVDQNEDFNFKHAESTKTLGLTWNPKQDYFTFESKLQPANKYTKRTLLSDISKLFDPLGWLSPLSTKLKLLFQMVWLQAIDWDDELPEEIMSEWLKIKDEIVNINRIKLPRWINTKENDIIELHGFCDASTKAFGCIIYCKIIRETTTSVILVAAKTRLVPTSKTVTLPKLELSSAYLLAFLMEKVKNSLEGYTVHQYGWTDSMATLGWIQGEPSKWTFFVSKRVKKITSIMPVECWHYVKSSDNPADAASRGQTATQLVDNNLWWQGPHWLKSSNNYEHQRQKHSTHLEKETIMPIVMKVQAETSIISNLLQKFNCLTKIIRILALVYRFIPPIRQTPSYLTLNEINKAKVLIIKYTQHAAFQIDIEQLQQQKQLNSQSKLLNLTPFIDEEGVLRAGGRIKHASVKQETKHPAILPSDSRLTTLIIEQAHQMTFHGGPRLTLAFLRQQYWILHGNRVTKAQIRKCVTCRKQQPILQQQMMGDLPAARVNESPPFYHTAIDYTGMVDVKANKGRGVKCTKGYIAVFICMVTKAIHLELVSDLSSASFLAALHRMAARRGAPRHIYSDNGTNFVGANRILEEEWQELQKIFNDSFYKEISEMQIQWHFNAPSWPSAGGLWERAVKSLKHHMKRVIGVQKLTYEEFSTLLARIEACLNSRPLCPLTEDINDLDCLTPAHFLTSRAGLQVIETDHDARTRWHLTNKLHQDIWYRWKTEYLTQLSVRSKWLKKRENIKVGDLVTIHEDNIPAGKWALGRVTELHSGSDQLVRVVTLKTKNGYIKRPISKLSVLPIRNQSELDQSSTAEEENKDFKRQKRTRKPTRSTFVTLALALMYLLTFISNGSCLYKLSELNTNQTIYFDPIAKLQTVREKWNLVVYHDLGPYWEGRAALQKQMKYLSNICSNQVEQGQCNTTIIQLEQDVSDLQYYDKLLLRQQFEAHARRRRRRGLVNGVGYIANSLFGVLDSRFAEQYDKDIALIKSDQRHLYKLYRNQTSVIEAEFNMIKRTEDMIYKQHKYINKQFDTLNKKVNSIEQSINDIYFNQDYVMSTITAMNLIQNLRKIQEVLIDSITDVFNGKINLHLLTPEQLQRELSIISGQISQEAMLPIDDINGDLSRIYKFVKVRARITINSLICEISIPLISRDSYQIYKTIPVPQQVNGNSVEVTPLSQYIAMNIKKDSYILLSPDELQSCLHYDEIFMCHFQKPIHHLASEENFCEKDSTNNQCKIKKSECRNKWTELNEHSTYLYFCCNTYQLKVICDDQVIMKDISRAGIIYLSDNCMIKDNEYTLYSQKSQRNSLLLKAPVYTPKLTEINHLINTSITLDNSTEDLIPATDHTDMQTRLAELDKQIQKMKEEQFSDDDMISSHDIHHYSAIYMILVVCIIFVVVFLRRHRGRARRRVVELQPAAPARDSLHRCESAVVNESVCEQVKRSDTELRAISLNSEKVNCEIDTASSPILRKVTFTDFKSV